MRKPPPFLLLEGHPTTLFRSSWGVLRDRAELSRFYSLGIGIVSIVWAHLSDGRIGSETCGDGGRSWNNGDGVRKAEDAPVKFDNVPSTLDQFSLQRKEVVLQGGVVASQPILPFSEQSHMTR